GDDDADVALGLDLREREIGLEPSPGPLDVCVGIGLEVVHDRAHRPPGRRGHVHGIPGLAQAVEDVVDLEIFDGVAGKHEYPFHRAIIAQPRARCSTQAPASGKSAATANPAPHDVALMNGAKASGTSTAAVWSIVC